MAKPGIIRIAIVFLLVAALMNSCKRKEVPRIPVANVFDKYLYLSDIQHIFPRNVNKEDSIALANSYITTWVKTQLLVNKAELNLTKDQLDIEEQIEAYRSSLLIFKYEEQMVKNKLDTLITDAELEEYYNQNTSSFILDDNIIKALYIKIPKNAPDIGNIKKWYKSEQREDIKKLDSYCFNYANKYDYFKDNWITMEVIRKEIPTAIENEDDYLKTNNFIEQTDDNFFYLVYIKEHSSRGSIAPFDYIKPKIKDIILNKRKVKFLSELENNLYNDAQDHNKFVIYKIDKK